MISPIGEAWSYTKPSFDRSFETSNAFAPCRPFSSPTVNSSSTPTGVPSTAARCASARRIATVALLSAPRIVSPALSQAPSTSTGSTTPSCGTVSRCAHSTTERSPLRPGRRARRLPASPPICSPASSSATSSPSERSSSATRSATARSWPNGLGIAHSSANVSFSRRSSTSDAGRIATTLQAGASGGARRADLAALGRSLAGALERGRDELSEQRRRPLGARLELGVELRGDEERVVVELDDLDEALVRRRARHDEPRGLQALAQRDRHLVAMTVALVDDGLAVRVARAGVAVQLDRVGAEAHRPAEVGDLLLLGQQVDHRPFGLDVELGRVRALHPGDVAGEIAHGDLHAQADAEVRDAVLARELDGADLALDAAAAEAAGDEDAVGAAEDRVRDRLVLQGLGVDPVDLDLPAVQVAGVAQRLAHREV